MTTDIDTLRDMAQKLKDKQDALEPYLTWEMMRTALNMKSDGHLYYYLNQMVEIGLAERVMFGMQEKYRFK